MKNNRSFKPFSSNNSRSWIILLLTAALGLGIAVLLTDYSRGIQTLSYSTFMKQVETHQVKEVYVVGQKAYGQLKNNQHFETVLPENSPHLWETLRSQGIEVSVGEATSGSSNSWYMVIVMGLLGIAAMVWFFVRQSKNASGSSGLFTMTRSKARMFLPSQIKTTFA